MKAPEIPLGLCQCGCGQQTKIARCNSKVHGWVRGRPLKFVHGHGSRRRDIEYLVDPATGCWIWQRAKSKNGYGRLGPDYAHRVFYERFKGQIPEGQQVHHRCKVKACVNPEHLVALHPEAHGSQEAGKLSADQVAWVRDRLERGGLVKDIAYQLDVHPTTVTAIKLGRSYRQEVECPQCGHHFAPYAKSYTTPRIAKMSYDQIAEALALVESGGITQREVAEQFGVCRQRIGQLVQRYSGRFH